MSTTHLDRLNKAPATRVPSQVRYEDFVLQLDANSRGGFRARVVKSPFGEGATSFVLPSIAETGLAGGFPSGAPARDVTVSPARPAAVELTPTEIGSEIYRAVFQGAVRSLFDKSRGQLERSPEYGLRLKIKFDPGDPDTVALADLPWELLCDSETEDFFALSRQTSLVRYLDVPRMSQPIAFTPPLRVLAVSASPRTLPPLDLDEEARRLEKLRQGGLPIELRHIVHASAGAVREALVSSTWHVVHFMGHGHYDAATGEGMLAFEGAGGSLDLQSGRAFATKLKDAPFLGVVVLNACNTARAGRDSTMNPFHGVANALVLGGVRAVVAMQKPISDLSAIRFSAAFYRHLARGDSIDEALTEGRQAIHSAAPEAFEWATPVLFLRIPAGDVFTAQAAAAPVATAAAAAPGGRGRLLKGAAGAGTLALLAGGIYLGTHRPPQTPPSNTDGNVAPPPVVTTQPNPSDLNPVGPPKPDTTATASQPKDPSKKQKQPLLPITQPVNPPTTTPVQPNDGSSPDAAQEPADLSDLSAQATAIAQHDGGLRVTASFRNSGATPLSLALDRANIQLTDDQNESYLTLRTSLPLAGGNPRLVLAAGATLNAQFDFPAYKRGSKTFQLVLATADHRAINVSGNLTIPEAP